jgi:integrase
MLKDLDMTMFFEPDEIRELGSLDHNLNFYKTYRRFASDIDICRREALIDTTRYRLMENYAYRILGLIQLRNGSRVGEALDALILFVENPVKMVSVLTLKRRDTYLREMILPDEVTLDDLKMVKEVILRKNLKVYFDTAKRKKDLENHKRKRRAVCVLSHFFRYHYKFSSHALRYSWINFITSEKKEPVSIVARITGHKSMELIYRYTGRKAARKALIHLFDNL